MKGTPQNAHFSGSSLGAWELKAEKELGVTPASYPFLDLGNGRSINSYYKKLYLRNEDLKEIQNTQKKTPGFKSIAPLCHASDNGHYLQQLEANGVDGFLVNLDRWETSSVDDLRAALSLAPPKPIFFQFKNQDFEKWQSILKNTPHSGGWAIDPVVQWMSGQGSYTPMMAALTASISNSPKEDSSTAIMLSGTGFFRAGATPVLELSLTIAALVTYLDYFTDRGISPGKVLSRIAFSVQVGSFYLTEIAKLRALRTLIARIGQHYGVPHNRIVPNISGSCSLPKQTIGEPFQNLIRMSSEAMSLIVGGCDAVIMQPFTKNTNISSSTASSLPLNIPLILQHEAMLDQVADPAAGSYLIEKITYELIKGAWSQFLEIEEKGGLIPFYESGDLKKQLDESWESKLKTSEVHPHFDESSMEKQNISGKSSSYFLPDRYADYSCAATTNLTQL